MNLLAADIGGTKTLIQLCHIDAGRVAVLHEQRYASADFGEFHSLLQRFLEETGQAQTTIDAACLAVAGPVERTSGKQWAKVTNLPWRIESQVIVSEFPITQVCLINDFTAVAYGILTLEDEVLSWLQSGRVQPHGPCLVAGAGTGFGVAQLLWDGSRHQVLPSEAGHADFSPSDALQDKLAAYLREKQGRCPIESVLSGPGLVNIYDFLLWHHELDANAVQGAWIARQDAAAISEAAAAGKDAVARQALELFCAIYGATLGNLALFSLPRGGIYVAGGIAPRIIQQLRSGAFLSAFKNKGKMARLMETLPLAVVMNPQVGLQGARLYAEKYCKSIS